MSAMPERVWLTRYDGWYTEPVGDGPCFVPESRLLAAEARVREVEALLDARNFILDLGEKAMADELAALRADLAALEKELARYKELVLTMGMPDA